MLAVIEQETEKDYLAEQYVIRNGWKLYIGRDDANTKWIVKRIMDDGTSEVLDGKRKIFYDIYARCPKNKE